MCLTCVNRDTFSSSAGFCLALGLLVLLAASASTTLAEEPRSSTAISLDSDEWLLAIDPQNVGREEEWGTSPRPDAKPAKVPWIIQDAFPGYHGVAWYWRDFRAPNNSHAEGRYLLRLWAVDYKADVWLNGVSVGGHEGGETPFTLDVTDAIKANANNRLAVRVLNPTHEPIDGIVLNQTPHRNKVIPYRAGASYNDGGIVDSVELLVVPAVRIEDLFARPDIETGKIRVHVNVRNATEREAGVQLEFAVAPAAGGETLDATVIERNVPPRDSVVEAELRVTNPRLWQLNEPNLYRVTTRVRVNDSNSFDEHSVRCGFREFRFDNGYFRLNGKRLFLRCSHTGNHCPVGLQLPPDPDMLRRDLLNVKVMGFNAIRFIAGVATRYQLDLCDEIGLMVYEEHYGSWCLADSPKMKERCDRALSEMILRDRNHPSVVIWGLLNETAEGPVFRNAVESLPMIRSLDDTRMVMLNSGRWDLHGRGMLEGLEIWRTPDGPDPNVTRNSNKRPLTGLGIAWQPGQMALHPGPKGEYSVARWTCPAGAEYSVDATFVGIAKEATTDVHVLHNGRSLHDGLINVASHGNESAFSKTLAIAEDDKLDFVVGFGNGFYGADTTAIAATIRSADGKVYDAAREVSVTANPNGPWQYGFLAPGPKPDVGTLKLYRRGETQRSEGVIGSLSNPGSAEWEDVLDDKHPYQRVPHTASVINTLRTISGGKHPLFVSEYGVGSAVDLWRVTRHYERLGKEHVEDAQFYRDKLDQFLADWDRWKMSECFASPQDFFAQSIRQMAAERLYGLNALRSNPSLVAHSLTGTVDQGMSGEGLFTTFRELKPGTTDALFEALAPLRLCLFVEPLHVYRGARVKLEAVLANEDALSPGEYPVRLQVIGPKMSRVVDRVVTVIVSAENDGAESPFALPFFSEDVTIDGPGGAYWFVATIERGGAPTGGEAVFHVADADEMPNVETEIVLWGDDPELTKWLAEHGIRTRPFSASEFGAGLPTPPKRATEGLPAAGRPSVEPVARSGDRPQPRELILVSATPPAGGAEAWKELVRRIARGASVVFLSPSVFKRDDNPTGWLPMENKGTLSTLMGWLYHKDEWAKKHPVFDGLPSGGMMDYAFYRQIIPDAVFAGLQPPAHAIAGANNASFDYSSGLMLAEYRLGEGRFFLNTLLIRENLSTNPVAERLLRNLLRHAAQELDEPSVQLEARREHGDWGDE